MLGRLGAGIGGKGNVLLGQPGGQLLQVAGGLKLFAHLVEAFGRYADVELLQVVDAAPGEQAGVVVVEGADLCLGRPGRRAHDLFGVGASQDFTAGKFKRLHDLGVAVELAVFGLLHHQFLIDKAFERGGTGLFDLLSRHIAGTGQHVVELMNGDFFLIDLDGDLGGRFGAPCTGVGAAAHKYGGQSQGKKRGNGR
ncbi:hypothetical protein SDC9_158983 [bioreactor metagenome]|uniref:Uncharacterized protein n=1 Tax=bioreactor metagenome TaxID=1076179 RepID=A0A645FDK7_9ZZZZ